MLDVLAAQRDRGAFDVLYRLRPGPGLQLRLLPARDHHEAEDATERTFLSALSALDRFTDDGATFRAWLFRIAHNTIANAHRTRHRRRTEPMAGSASIRPGADPAGVVARADEGRAVRAAWPASPPTGGRRSSSASSTACRPGIGAVLDRSEGAARVLLHRALRDLARELDPGEDA